MSHRRACAILLPSNTCKRIKHLQSTTVRAVQSLIAPAQCSFQSFQTCNFSVESTTTDSRSTKTQTLTLQQAQSRVTASGISQSFLSNSESFKVTQVSFEGKITTVNLPPSEISARTSIMPRDLVSLQLTSREERYGQTRRRNVPRPTAILPRTDCILLSFGHVRAVATHDSVYVLDSHSRVSKSFAKDLAALYMTDQSNEAAELIFLESVLKETVDTFSRRIRLYEPIVDNFLTRVSNEVFSDQGVHLLVPLKDSLLGFELQVKQCLECLTEMLNDDEQMLKLLLTEQAEARQHGGQVDFERHQHVELMLTVYSRQMYNLSQEIGYLLSRLKSKQEFVTLALAGYRNRLVRMNVNIGIVAVATGVTTAMTGLFGMNLISGLEEHPTAFWTVVTGSGTVAMSVMLGSLHFIRGGLMQERAEQRLAEIETLTSALSDMAALDYTVKKMLQEGDQMGREDFKAKLTEARQSQSASDDEVEFLFSMLDTHKDDMLTARDFSTFPEKKKK